MLILSQSHHFVTDHVYYRQTDKQIHVNMPKQLEKSTKLKNRKQHFIIIFGTSYQFLEHEIR